MSFENEEYTFTGRQLLDLVGEAFDEHVKSLIHCVTNAIEPMEIVLEAHESEGFINGISDLCRRLGVPAEELEPLCEKCRNSSTAWREANHERLVLKAGADMM